jgi:integrase
MTVVSAQRGSVSVEEANFEPAAKAAGFPELRIYDLRHTFASLLLAAGRSLPDVAGELGHGIDVLTSTYAHVIAEYRGRKAIDPDTEIQLVRRSRRAV